MRRLPVLDKTRCAADWNAMTGDAYVRHCRRCDQNVYNLTMMGSAEAARLVEKHEGQLCVRFFVRADGTAIARDCSPDRWRAIKLAAAIAIGSALGAALVPALPAREGERVDAGRWIEHRYMYMGKYEGVQRPCERPGAPVFARNPRPKFE